MSTGHLVNIMEQILSPMPLVISALLLNLINLRDAAAQQFFHDSTYLEVAVARTPFEIQSSSGVNYASPLESLPFELYGNLILIRVRVNHSEPLRFILDSGAGVSFLNRTHAVELGLKLDDRGERGNFGIGEGKTKVAIVKGVSFSLGSIDLPPIKLRDNVPFVQARLAA